MTLVAQIDFDKVFGPAAYKDATNAKVMFGRLLSKIVDEGVKGTPGRSKATRKGKGKTKQTSAAGGFDDAPALGESANDDNHSSPSTAKTTKKRKTAASTKDGTPSKRGRGNPKKSEVKEEEKVVVGSGSNEGKLPIPVTMECAVDRMRRDRGRRCG